jgi:hypothetical protein
MNMEEHFASSPQILSLFPQNPIEMEEQRDVQGSGSMENGSGLVEYDMGSSMGAFQGYPHSHQVYPSPLAEHETLLANHAYFCSLFNSFHAVLGTSITVPNIGGEELDLHLLYKQVTACGGLEQVIKERRWKEIATALKIPSSIINYSFVLRKHYVDLLYHFEQVHYFGARGQLAPPPGPLPAPRPSTKSMDNGITYQLLVDPKQPTKRKKNMVDPAQLFGVDPGAYVGQTVTGAVDQRFDNGYLVTVVVGSEKLKGVLYHVPTESTVQQYAMVPGLMSNVGCDALGLEVQVTKKRKERIPKRDPSAPRLSKTGYKFFYVEQCARLKKTYAQTDREIVTTVNDLWNKLSDNEKMQYIERSQQDKKRRKTQIMTYKERMKLQDCSEGYNGDKTSEVIGQKIEGNGTTSYFHDNSYDYHVSLDAEADANSFHSHQQRGIPSEVTGIPVADHGAYSGEGDKSVYSVCFPPPEISAPNFGGSSLQQTYVGSGDQCFYQTQSSAFQSSFMPYPMTPDQIYWMQGGQSYNIQDGQTLSLYPQNPFI